MRALVVHEHGGIDKLALEDVADPTPRPGEVLVDVRAASVNFPDLLVIGGSYQRLPPRPFSPGKDLAGVVAAVGQGVKRCKPGERVVAQIEFGAYAEKCVVPEGNCHVMPASMSFAEGAAMGLTYLTAHFALVERGGLRAGETVLVNGAAGGVGLATVQVAKALGATVVASVGSEAKAALARASGADHIVRTDPSTSSGQALRDWFREQVFAAIGARGVDLVIDPVGGDVFDASLRVMAWCGRLVIVGFAAGRIPEIKAGYLLVKNISLIGLQWSDYRDRDPEKVQRAQDALFRLYEAGRIKPHVMAAYPLEEHQAALRAVRDRIVAGKVVLLMDERREPT
ncbi:MAG TPA: NADPH:quinone oxidoreductase family protein [Burkholderiales bacterium]|nr:NADPH:quinone oxidoreductase family protein [Burkholderiales bacterium]